MKLACPRDVHGLVIGKAGRTVHELQRKYSVKIVLSRETEEAHVMGNNRGDVADCFNAISSIIKTVSQ